MTAGPWSRYKTDKTKEAEGMWSPFDGFDLKLRRAGATNKAFAKVYAEDYLRPFAKELDADTLTDEVAAPALASIYARTIVTAWRSKEYGEGKVPGPDGKPLDFTTENVEFMLLDIPEILRLVQGRAATFANYLRDEIEADAKN